MAAAKEQRVDDALQQLLSRILPPIAGEDEADEDKRYEEALQFARDTIGKHARICILQRIIKGPFADTKTEKIVKTLLPLPRTSTMPRT